jgi:hypothetical protein
VSRSRGACREGSSRILSLSAPRVLDASPRLRHYPRRVESAVVGPSSGNRIRVRYPTACLRRGYRGESRGTEAPSFCASSPVRNLSTSGASPFRRALSRRRGVHEHRCLREATERQSSSSRNRDKSIALAIAW